MRYDEQLYLNIFLCAKKNYTISELARLQISEQQNTVNKVVFWAIFPCVFEGVSFCFVLMCFVFLWNPLLKLWKWNSHRWNSFTAKCNFADLFIGFFCRLVHYFSRLVHYFMQTCSFLMHFTVIQFSGDVIVWSLWSNFQTVLHRVRREIFGIPIKAFRGCV